MAGKTVRLKVSHILKKGGDKGTDKKFVAGEKYDEEELKKFGIPKSDYEEVTESKK